MRSEEPVRELDALIVAGEASTPLAHSIRDLDWPRPYRCGDGVR